MSLKAIYILITQVTVSRLSLELQNYIFNCLSGISTWFSYWHLTLNIVKWNFWFLLSLFLPQSPLVTNGTVNHLTSWSDRKFRSYICLSSLFPPFTSKSYQLCLQNVPWSPLLLFISIATFLEQATVISCVDYYNSILSGSVSTVASLPYIFLKSPK